MRLRALRSRRSAGWKRGRWTWRSRTRSWWRLRSSGRGQGGRAQSGRWSRGGARPWAGDHGDRVGRMSALPGLTRFIGGRVIGTIHFLERHTYTPGSHQAPSACPSWCAPSIRLHCAVVPRGHGPVAPAAGSRMIRADAALGRSEPPRETGSPAGLDSRSETLGAAVTDFPSRPSPPVAAEGLVKTYGDRRAVDRIDFEVRDGVCFGFLGPNGAGKTTTMRMLYGRLRRDSGRLDVLGLDPDRCRRQVRQRLGVVTQANDLDQDLDVRENLVVFAGHFGLHGR